MKNLAKILLGGVVLFSSLSLLGAELTSTTKKSNIIRLDDFSGSLSFGHNNSTKFDEVEKDKISETDVSLSASLSLGLSTFGGNVNYYAGTSYGMDDGQTNLETNSPYAGVSIGIAKGKYGSLRGSVGYSFAFNNSAASGSPRLSYSAPGFSIGKVSISSSLSIGTKIYGKEHMVDATVVNSVNGYNEDDPETVEVEQTDLSYSSSAGIRAGYPIESIKDLSVGASVRYSNSYSPKYTVYDGGIPEAEYKSSGSSSSSLSLNYSVSERVNFSTALVFKTDDFYGEPKSGKSSRFVNSTSLSISLF